MQLPARRRSRCGALTAPTAQAEERKSARHRPGDRKNAPKPASSADGTTRSRSCAGTPRTPPLPQAPTESPAACDSNAPNAEHPHSDDNPPSEPATPHSCRPGTEKGAQNARFRAESVPIHYRFHPYAGERVVLIGRLSSLCGRALLVRTRAGTEFSIPEWMSLPESAHFAVRDRPRLSRAALADLRAIVDSLLETACVCEGGEHGGESAGTVVLAAGPGDAATGCSRAIGRRHWFVWLPLFWRN